MNIYSKLLAVMFVLLLTVGIGSCEQMSVNPNKQDLEIGGYAEYNITITCDDSDKEVGDHQLNITFYNETSGELTHKLNGKITSTDVDPSLSYEGPSKISYDWTVDEVPETYNFTLNITINKSATVEVGEEFAIQIEDSGESVFVESSAVAYVDAVPEMLTAVLVGIGVVSMILWRRNS